MLPRLKEGGFIAALALCLYFVLALGSYSSQDPGWSTTGESGGVILNAVGRSGAWVADFLFSQVGYTAYLIPLMLAYRAWILFRERYDSLGFDWATVAIRVVGLLLVLISSTGLSAFNDSINAMFALPNGNGGSLGLAIRESTYQSFNLLGSRLVLVSVFLFGMTIFTDLSWLRMMDKVGELTFCLFYKSKEIGGRLTASWKANREARQVQEKRKAVIESHKEKEKKRPKPKIEKKPKPVQKGERIEREKQQNLFESPSEGQLPPLNLLHPVDSHEPKGYSAEALEAMSRLLELKLLDFGVEAEVTAVYPGPVITRFEIQPAPGVKVSKISGLAKDLARSLAVISVRVVEVIPGKSVIGIEIPNEDREIVLLSQVLSSKTYDNAKSAVTLALGKDISGEPVVADLAKMPHLLVAGTTGSGKSVGVNAMLLSLLFKSTADEVRLILVDPKMLELSVYEGIPHLLTPVITDMKDAANGLRWCVGEMERRYKLMAALGVRNLAGFNKKVREAAKTGSPIADPLWKPEEEFVAGEDVPTAPALEVLPAIVVVIDEFADMMMIVGKKVEELIARIAQKARAAGIHLILATQRPSVDVITGLIKANVPTRIGFQVSSKIDSRTILDQGGAEQLLGHGDMLYLPPGSGLPVRIHGAFVADEEVHAVVADMKRRGKPNYIESLLEDAASEVIPGLAASGSEQADSEADPLYDEAIQFVTDSRKASISAVQRKLRIGYNRAARMIEAMEAAGVVSAMSSNGQREVIAPPPIKD